MANKLGQITINNLLVISTDVSPMDGIGVSAPIGSFGSAADGSGIFYKSGALNTDWINLMSILPSVVQKNSLYTPNIFDFTVECTANSFVITLPSAIGIKGKIYNLLNIGSGVITIDTSLSQTINGIASGILTLVQYDNIIVQSNGSNWIKIN